MNIKKCHTCCNIEIIPNYKLNHNNDIQSVYMKCTKCGNTGPLFCCFEINSQNTENAIQLWNNLKYIND